MRLSVPKAFVVLRGVAPSADAAREIFRFVRERLPGYKRVRRLEFSDLPKTISGKIRRVELRIIEERRFADGVTERATYEFWEQDFPELRESYSVLR
jgi:acetyl-CoA synthetase